MAQEAILAKIGKLEAVTVERGAAPAEAATAARIARLLLRRLAQVHETERLARLGLRPPLAPGVHVSIT